MNELIPLCTFGAIAFLFLRKTEWINETVKHMPYRHVRHIMAEVWSCFFLSAYYCVTTAWALYMWIYVPGWQEDGLQCNYVTGEVPFLIRLLYLVQISFYMVSIAELNYKQYKWSKHMVMAVHHWITLILLVSSFSYGQLYVGIVILGLHDVGDIFLYLSDGMNKYTNLQDNYRIPRKDWMNTAKVIMFATFAILFVVCRIYMFGYVVTTACYRHVSDANPTRFMFWGLLALTCMHIYWFRQIVSMLWRLYNGNDKDVRD